MSDLLDPNAIVRRDLVGHIERSTKMSGIDLDVAGDQKPKVGFFGPFAVEDLVLLVWQIAEH